MKVTFILQDWSDAFYNGSEFTGAGLLALSDADKFAKLSKMSHEHPNVKMKIGSANSFRDRVDLNSMMRSPVQYNFKLEPRKGYKLASFNIEPALSRNPKMKRITKADEKHLFGKRKAPRTPARRKKPGITAAQIRAAHAPKVRMLAKQRYHKKPSDALKRDANNRKQYKVFQDMHYIASFHSLQFATEYAKALHSRAPKTVVSVEN